MGHGSGLPRELAQSLMDMTTIPRTRPLALRSVGALQAQLSRLGGRCWPHALGFLQRQWQAHAVGVESAPANAVAVELAFAGTAWRVASTHADLQVLLGPALGTLPPEALAPRLLLAMLQDLVLEAFDDAPVDVRPCSPASQVSGPGAASMRVRLQPAAGGPAVSLWVQAAGPAWQGMWPLLASAPPAPLMPAGPWGRLAFVCRVECGWSDMPLTAVRDLRTEDVIVGQAISRVETGAPLTLRLGRYLGIHCIHSGAGRIAARGAITMIHDEVAEAQTLSRPDADDAASLLGELPVRLTFDLGTQLLTLDELRAVAPGHVFDLGLLPHKAVSIRLNGLLAGEGELVEIDGRVGVAVGRFHPRAQ